MAFLKTYLSSIKDITLSSKEHSFRTQLENFLNEIKFSLAQKNKDFAKIVIYHEPQNDKSGFGAPDFQVIGGGGGI